jgi:hypothetical protein
MSELIVYDFGGSDDGDGSPSHPFKTIQKAIDVAPAAGYVIKVAGGKYAPFVVVNKWLDIWGGFQPGDGFSQPDPANHPTVIDGGQAGRCVYVHSDGPGNAALVLQDFTLQNGKVQGFGGGLLAERCSLVLRRCNFADCISYGAHGTDQDPRGGIGAGGGVAIFFALGTVVVEGCSCWDNSAIGGNGDAAGYGQGGGFFAANSKLQIRNLTTIRNKCIGGLSSGNGLKGFETADGIGGGVDLEVCETTIDGLVCTDNQSIGGNAEKGWSGGGFGGGLEAELGSLTLSNARVENNLALGANGPMNYGLCGGYASGGGLDLTNSECVVRDSQIRNNTSHAGNGSYYQPHPFGGGLHMHESLGNQRSFRFVNVRFEGNWARLGHSTLGNDDPNLHDILGATEVLADQTFTFRNQFGDR